MVSALGFLIVKFPRMNEKVLFSVSSKSFANDTFWKTVSTNVTLMFVEMANAGVTNVAASKMKAKMCDNRKSSVFTVGYKRLKPYLNFAFFRRIGKPLLRNNMHKKYQQNYELRTPPIVDPSYGAQAHQDKVLTYGLARQGL